jgi:hypothetical protein
MYVLFRKEITGSNSSGIEAGMGGKSTDGPTQSGKRGFENALAETSAAIGSYQ